MSQNPLLGSRISLISKKDIRYEGTLYSINESNATVALQNVRSFGTEGREKTEASTAFVGPQDAVHPYLLFRGQDIKDLHVHEEASDKPADPAIVSTEAPLADAMPVPPPPASTAGQAKKEEMENQGQSRAKLQPPQQQSQSQGGRGAGGQNRRPRKPIPTQHQVGTGASLLNRKARGSVQGGLGPDLSKEEFDFQSNLAEFEKEGDDSEDDEDAGDTPEAQTSYEKDDFFDSISCDALDRKNGLDNRLRGANERTLNTETFGAVALNSQRRRRGGRGRGPGGRGRGGRGRGRGRGREGRGREGRGRGGRGRGQYNNNGGNTGNPTPGSYAQAAAS